LDYCFGVGRIPLPEQKISLDDMAITAQPHISRGAENHFGGIEIALHLRTRRNGHINFGGI
jgi:hypothetical protein